MGQLATRRTEKLIDHYRPRLRQRQPNSSATAARAEAPFSSVTDGTGTHPCSSAPGGLVDAIIINGARRGGEGGNPSNTLTPGAGESRIMRHTWRSGSGSGA